MLRSLRFQLPAFFLLGVVARGPRLGRDRSPPLPRLRGGPGPPAGVRRAGARGKRPHAAVRAPSAGPTLALGQEARAGDRRPDLLRPVSIPSRASGGRRSSRCRQAADRRAVVRRAQGGPLPVPPAGEQPDAASRSAHPLKVGRQASFGAIVVAKPKTVLDQRWLALIERLLHRLRGRDRRRGRASPGTCHAGSRTPVLELSRRRRRGRARALRRRRARGARRRRDPPPRGSLPRDGGPALRGRGARAQLPDVGLARAAHAADGDPRPRRGVARRRGRPTRRCAPTR